MLLFVESQFWVKRSSCNTTRVKASRLDLVDSLPDSMTMKELPRSLAPTMGSAEPTEPVSYMDEEESCLRTLHSDEDSLSPHHSPNRLVRCRMMRWHSDAMRRMWYIARLRVSERDASPAHRKERAFAALPAHLAPCPWALVK